MSAGQGDLIFKILVMREGGEYNDSDIYLKDEKYGIDKHEPEIVEILELEQDEK